MTINKTKFAFIAKVMALPLVAGAMVGAQTVADYVNDAEPASAIISVVEPTPQEDGLDETINSHYIRLDEGNRFAGVIQGIDDLTGDTVGVEGLEVYLVQRSLAVYQSITNENGEFDINSVEPGTYSLVVSGDEGFMAHGVHFVAPEEEAGEEVGDSNGRTEILASFSAPTQLTAAVIPPKFTTLRKIMGNHLPARPSNDGSVDKDKIRINVEKSVVNGGFQVALTDEGELIGRVAPISDEKTKPIHVDRMTVYLIKDDKEYSKTTVESDGTFMFKNIEEGVYGFAAAGDDGFAALSFQAVVSENDQDASAGILNEDGAIETAARQVGEGVDFALNVALIPREDIPFVRDEMDIPDHEVPDAAELGDMADPGVSPDSGFSPDPGLGPEFNPGFNGSAPSGGFAQGGGGGGFGGGGPLFPRGGGRLAALAGVAGGIVAIATSGDDSAPADASPAQ